MRKIFLKRLAKEVKQFFKEQIVVGLAVAFTISLNQFRTGQISRSALSTDLVRIAFPYLVILVIVVLYHSFRTWYLLFKDLQQSQPSPVILTDAGSEAESRVRPRVSWIVACLVAAVLGSLGFLLSSRFSPSRVQVHRPDPPTIVSISSEYDWEFGEQKGQLSQGPSFSPCFERGAKVYPLNDLSSFPGGPNSKRPRLVFTTTRFSYIKLITQPDYYDLMFEISLVNRGEASIAKDWSLCVLQGGQPHRFIAQRYSSDTKAVFGDRTSIRDITFANPLEHGHAVSGWLLCIIPKELMDNKGTSIGSLQCKDYLDGKTSVGFGFSAPQVRKAPSKSTSGLSAVAH
jgi:hypothetical protein